MIHDTYILGRPPLQQLSCANWRICGALIWYVKWALCHEWSIKAIQMGVCIYNSLLYTLAELF